MKTLSHQGLINAYLEAINLQLEQEFIDMLLNELIRREILIEGLLDHADISGKKINDMNK
ncbi:sporulation histidine kinase inhibitor Sda [Paenibacillus planticolens]|uniref:Sporulation histidine kinase inhibitor Sda n=1 Tax=Paenibacillus planticolens TaxID=2654976 RepID=A0ABX1ZHL3_9BACL|nr:sporulation histidine kinase inhibitor Sda [Paenibacillus planticolens]NOU99565.1 sporulation histidine kinase inhibitor Sda [Paenibacillus planticolens]